MTKLIIIIFFSLVIFGCMPKMPGYKTSYGTECAKHCLYSHTYGPEKSYSKLEECYKSCQKAEEIREKAYRRWRKK